MARKWAKTREVSQAPLGAGEGDGLAIQDEKSFTVKAKGPSELMLFDLK